MASDWVVLGRVPDIDGHEVEVSRHVSGVVALNDDDWTFVLMPDPLRELLDRAAMPGQAARHPLYGCCDHCEHCGTCEQPGTCDHHRELLDRAGVPGQPEAGATRG